MEIYLMQHGQALPEAKDLERPLSMAGKTQIQTSARAIQKMGLRFDVIIASTKKRSKQTAEIIAEFTGCPSESIAETESVNPSAAPEAAIEYIGQTGKKSVFVAGHLPSLAKIASQILAKDTGVSVQFANSGLCRIDVERLPTHTGILRWLLTPDQLKLISGQ